jgi:hypothetical protein
MEGKYTTFEEFESNAPKPKQWPGVCRAMTSDDSVCLLAGGQLNEGKAQTPGQRAQPET